MLKHMVLAVVVLGLPATALAQDWKPLLKDDGLREWQSAGGVEVFHAKGGTLTVDGPGQIVYAGTGRPLDLKNFELKVEVLTRPGGKAGLAFHVPTGDPRASGGLEVRLDNSYSRSGPGQDLLKTGSLVWLRPVVRSVVPDGRWFAVHIAVQGSRVRVWVDDRLVVDYVEPAKVEAGPRLRHGTVAVRGHGGSGAVLIRKLQLKALKEGGPPAGPRLDEVALRLARLREQGFPLVDYRVRLQGRLTLEDVLARSRQTGIGAGVTVYGVLKTIRGRPVFVGLHAEGREWTRLFSPAEVARFDYVFADAMTITDGRGRRVRLGVKEEVDVKDPQAFMDLLVKNIEEILDREPIDYYASPTYLPEALAKDYDRLWTPARLKRVVDALARNDVALEINDRLRLPGPALIKMAREAGVKFVFGGDNGDGKLGRLDYCLRMVEECALTPDDLWAPRPDGQRPVQVRKRR